MARSAGAKLKTPYKDLLPPQAEAERDALKASIKAEGVREPIKVDEDGNILDGHGRFAIDRNAPRQVIKGLSAAEKKAFVFRSNLTRRNLSNAQKIELRSAMKAVAKELRVENPKKNTQARVAMLLGVDRTTVTKWLMQNVNDHNTHKPPAKKPDARTTLTKEGKEAAVKECQKGKSQAQVAANMGVSQSTVSRTVTSDTKQKKAARVRRKAAKEAEGLGELGIKHVDYREAGSEIAKGCVDLIFTDPPYDRETLPQYEDLGQFAHRILKPGGSLICYLGDYQLPEVAGLVLKTKGMKFWWPLVCVHTGVTTNMKQWGVIVKHKMMLWFVKGKSRATKEFVHSLVMSEKDKDYHDWGQGIVEARYYINKLVPKGGFVVDPYCGGGTTCVAAKQLSRRYLAFETDRDAALGARKRITECEKE